MKRGNTVALHQLFQKHIKPLQNKPSPFVTSTALIALQQISIHDIYIR